MNRMKKAVRILLSCMLVFLLAAALSTVFGAEAGESAEAAAATARGVGMIAAALSTGIAAIGSGIAVGAGAPAAIGALTEDPKTFGKSMIFVALGEGIALSGMLISILILNKV